MTTSHGAKRAARRRVRRFKLDRIRMDLWKLRLGRRGAEALSRLLTSQELPLNALGVQFERAYKIRRKVLKGTSDANIDEIVVERSFNLPGVSRFMTILVRPFPSVEEVNVAIRQSEIVDVVPPLCSLQNGDMVMTGPPCLNGARGEVLELLRRLTFSRTGKEAEVKMRQIASRRGRVVVSGIVLILVGGGIFSTEIASATSSSKMSIIAGVLRECPPDPAFGRYAPNPAMVVLLRNGRTYSSQPIVFPKKGLWTGVFRFSVQPGTYQVVSSYQGGAPTVTAKAGGKYTVSFGIIGCPE
jgi:hypothetical protein